MSIEMLCEFCQVEPVFNFHHFIPRKVHRNKWFKRRYDRQELQAGMRVCNQCHRTIHQFCDEKELARQYNTRDKLLTHEGIARYVAWKRRRLPTDTASSSE